MRGEGGRGGRKYLVCFSWFANKLSLLSECRSKLLGAPHTPQTQLEVAETRNWVAETQWTIKHKLNIKLQHNAVRAAKVFQLCIAS